MTNKRASKTGKDSRRSLGKAKPQAMLPVPPPRSEVGQEYGQLLDELKLRIAAERVRVVLAANAAMVLLYWDIGRTILDRQAREGWGAKVIDRLSADLRESFPDMTGLSSRNLKYMRAFADAWPDREIVQDALAQITWYHNLTLLEKIDSPETRLWYARKTVENGWSRNILVAQVSSQLHLRQGRVVSNFPGVLPPLDSDMAEQIFKDPYLFDFLGTADPRREREVERALVDHLEKFLLELGQGFAFVGRQVQLEVGNQDFVIDLLFYHLRLRCFVVVELKAVPFDPAFVGQLNLYLSAVDDILRHPDDKPTIGLLLCQGKERMVVEYALRGLQQPLGVADWDTQIIDRLPDELRGTLPTVEQLEAELSTADSTNQPATRTKTRKPTASKKPAKQSKRKKRAK